MVSITGVFYFGLDRPDPLASILHHCFFFIRSYLMRTLTASFILIAWLATCRSAPAVVVDFEDLATATFGVGNSFDSGGVHFNIVAYNGAGSSLSVFKS